MQVQFRGSFKHKILKKKKRKRKKKEQKITQLSKTTLSMSDFPKSYPFNCSRTLGSV